MANTIMVVGGYAPSLLNFRGDLLRAIRDAGWRVVACAPNPDPELVSDMARQGIECRRLDLDRTGLNPLRDLATLREFAALLRQIRPQVLLPYTVKPVLYGSLAARLVRGTRVVSLITGLGSLFAEGSSPLKRVAVHGMFRLALAHNETVVFQNPDDRDHFVDARLVASHRAAVIAGSGVNLSRFSPAPLPPGPPRFLMIARLLVDKGVREYAAAAALLRQRGYDVRCDLVGPLERHARAVAAAELEEWTRRGLVRWHGSVADVRPYLHDCAVYVLPSAYREGTPRSILEALATGRPVITTDTPGCRQTVVDGINGYLVPPRDPRALAEAMERFLRDPDLLPAMASASLRIAREQFDVDLVNRDLLAILRISPEPPVASRSGS